MGLKSEINLFGTQRAFEWVEHDTGYYLAINENMKLKIAKVNNQGKQRYFAKLKFFGHTMLTTEIKDTLEEAKREIELKLEFAMFYFENALEKLKEFDSKFNVEKKKTKKGID